MENIKNSVLSKCFQALLIGYFLISSINVSNTFNNLITQNSEVESTKGIVCNILKKLFNCDGCPEELEEFENKTKSGKGLFLIDYLVPGSTYVVVEHFNTISKDNILNNNLYFVISPYTKIHLPPPEFLI